MTASPLETHAGAAAKLYAQRRRQLAKPWIGADTLARLERRLRAHLSTVADLQTEAEAPPPDKRDPAFVHWAARLLIDPESAFGELIEALGAGDDAAAGAFDALSLLPAGDERVLERIEAGSDPAVWGLFLRSRSAAGVAVSGARINAALAADEEDVRCAAVEAAAADAGRGADYFRPWYAAGSTVPHRIGAVALFAGLVRGDAEAGQALGPALERAETDEDRNRILRLMALGGSEQHRETLELFAQRDPASGAPLLALNGQPGLLDTLIECLQRPEGAEAAATAWWRMTGQTLPRAARLQSVGEGGSAARGEAPDAEWAAGWLRRHRSRLMQHPRLLFGEALDRRTLARACRRQAGTAAGDLIDQAHLWHGPGLRVHADQWIALRHRRLDEAGLSDQPTVPPEAAEANPWEHGHYA